MTAAYAADEYPEVYPDQDRSFTFIFGILEFRVIDFDSLCKDSARELQVRFGRA